MPPPAAVDGDRDEEMRDVDQSDSSQAAAGAASGETETAQDDTPFKQRIRVLPGDSETAASFEFTHEDHTLGNALRYIIMRNPVVEFCGYSIPHPSDPKMNLRIQTYDNASVYEVMEKGLNDLMELCDVVLDKFEAARDEFGKTTPMEE